MTTTREGTLILIVEDDLDVATLLRDYFTSEGYEVAQAGTGAAAEELLRSGSRAPDLILLDLVLPDVDGLVLLAKIRARYSIPVVVCTGTQRRHDPALALRLGADDFVLKPFDIDVLGARVEAVLRQAAPRQEAEPVRNRGDDREPLRVGALTLDYPTRTVRAQGMQVHLTPTEFRLLHALAREPDAILTRRELAQQMWGYRNFDSGRLVDVHVRRLREKLNAISGMTVLIVAIRGEGYKLMLAPGASRRDVSA